MPETAATRAFDRSFLAIPTGDPIRPELASLILNLKFSESDIERMNLLAAKAQSGELSDAEAGEMDNFRRIGHQMALMHSKARKSLQ